MPAVCVSVLGACWLVLLVRVGVGLCVTLDCVVPLLGLEHFPFGICSSVSVVWGNGG